MPIPLRTVNASLAACLVVSAALVACRGNENYLPVPGKPLSVAGASSAASTPALVLPLEVDLPAAEAFVRTGYGLEPGKNFQATSFLTTRLRTVQAQSLVRIVKSYNDFEGEKVAEALGRFRGKVSAIEFGRSGSPVLFVELPYWTHQREETTASGMGVKISDEDNQALVAQLKEVFVNELKAREFAETGRRIGIGWR